MINLLGSKIIVTILVSVLICSGVGALSYFYMMPTQEKYNTEINTLNGKVRAKQADINQLKYEFDILKDQIVKFNILKKRGFFNAQDRVTARETISELTRQAKLSKADLTLPAAQIVQNNSATSANHSLLSGPMTIKVEAVDDLSVYRYIVALQRIFPGYLEFKSFNASRADGDLMPKLNELKAGAGVPALVTGEVQFVWWSMASQAQMEANPYFNPSAIVPAQPVPGQP